MADPRTQSAKQLRNIEELTGKTVAGFAAAIREAGVEKHGQIVAYLKSEHGLTHGNANLLALTVRELWAGGPPPPEDLLANQYSGTKAALRPIYEKLAAIAENLGDDVDKVIQKTGVSFRRKKQFVLVQAPSAKRIQLGLNLDETPSDARIVEAKGMCTHTVNIADLKSVDDDITSWIKAAYERAG
jgi:predicted transport protein